MEDGTKNKKTQDSVKIDSDNKIYSTCQVKSEGEIFFTVTDFLNLKKKVESPKIRVGLCSWSIRVEPELSNDQKHLNFYVSCNSENKDASWNCQAEVELVVVNHNNFKGNYTKMISKCFTSEQFSWGYKKFMNWNTICDLDKGFINVNGSATFQGKIRPAIPDVIGCNCGANSLSQAIEKTKASNLELLNKNSEERSYQESYGNILSKYNKLSHCSEAKDQAFPKIIEFDSTMPCVFSKLSSKFSDANVNPSTETYELTDVVLCIDNNKIHVHRLVLEMASKYFERMFATEMKESKSKEVQLKEIDLETLKSLIKFAYTHTVESKKINVKLLAASDYFEVLCLMEICSAYLSKNLSLKNVTEICLAAYLHNIEDLTNDAVAFMAKHFKLLYQDENFCKWTDDHPHLLRLISVVLARKCDC